ncbi:glycoside hydrolase family 31 protein [Neobacillus sp. 179-C4.2 HS]|uniref:Glycoside hydrolase family 31 protein n=1 Tax=Neobacillus driksii TaxID=3035913 RepID=A0ABV4YPJ6_9BACI|nr:glycoside hydrolase family 31 protein [Neobacillus sp. 179.-C4.2 HS]MDP5195563.1 glycoside hydrolase family 31 protein [Neobacillus sp. 179.-C4.2 HS]
MSIREKYMFKFINEDNNCLSFKLDYSNFIARVFVLENDIVRVLMTNGEELSLPQTWLVAPGMDDVPMEGRQRLDISPFSLPTYVSYERDEVFYIETSALKVEINLNGFNIHWYHKDPEQSDYIHFMNDRKTQAYNFDGSLGEGIFHYIERTREESYYGLGEKAGDTDRYGKRYRMMNLDPMGYDAQYTDPLYKHIPFYITRNDKTNISFGIFYDNMSKAVFDMGNEMDNYHGWYRYFQSDTGDLDYYIIAGPEVKDVVKRYTWLTGKPIFQPKWSLGYSGSTMTYTDLPKSQERLNEFLQLCEEHDIICDSFQLSSGYTSIGDKRYVFNWNRDKFPDPKGFTDGYHEKNVHLCANIKPCLLKDHPLFEELQDKGMFIKSEDGKTPEMAQFWDEVGAYLDFTNKETYAWWKKKVTEALLEYGIDSTWNDNNEFEIWTKNVKSNGFGQEVNFELVRALQPLLMMKASYEAQKEFSPEVRPYLISRSGSPGMQRYVQTWTGDNYTSWKTVKYNIKMAVGLSLSGVYNIGHDIGGFSGPAPSPELFVRWVQNGIFYPRFTIHSWNDDQTVNVPWMYEETAGHIRDLIKFRHRLTPYLYTLLYNAHDQYEPIIKPTFYEFGQDKKTFEECDDFMLGDSILVTSVVEEGATERSVYLPECDGGWYDYHTSIWYESGQTVTIPAPLTYAPFLVKAGSIIPVNDADCSFLTKTNDERGFELFPHQQTGTSDYVLYEDDGISSNYQENHTKLHVHMKTTSDRLEVSLEKEGVFELAYKQITFYLPKGETRELVVNGQPLQQTDDGSFVYQL